MQKFCTSLTESPLHSFQFAMSLLLRGALHVLHTSQHFELCLSKPTNTCFSPGSTKALPGSLKPQTVTWLLKKCPAGQYDSAASMKVRKFFCGLDFVLPLVSGRLRSVETPRRVLLTRIRHYPKFFLGIEIQIFGIQSTRSHGLQRAALFKPRRASLTRVV